MILCLEHAGQFLAKKGVDVFNATAGGKLESFPRVPYDGVFDKSSPHCHTRWEHVSRCQHLPESER